MQKPSLDRLIVSAKERRLRDWVADLVALGGAALLAKSLDEALRQKTKEYQRKDRDEN